MDKFEQQLQQELKTEPLKDPSQVIDDKILNLISGHKVSEKESQKKRWIPFAIAASLMAVTVYWSGNFQSSEPIKSELDLAFESSRQLEQSINQLENLELSPAVFIEISRLNQQIANIDESLQPLLSGISNASTETTVMTLMTQRIEKLNLMKSLYSADASLLRI